MFRGTKSNLLSGIHFFLGLKTASILGYEPVAILKSTRRMKYFLCNLYNQTEHQCDTVHFGFHHRNWICMSCTMNCIWQPVSWLLAGSSLCILYLFPPFSCFQEIAIQLNRKISNTQVIIFQ